jgi:hypothetical protein
LANLLSSGLYCASTPRRLSSSREARTLCEAPPLARGRSRHGSSSSRGEGEELASVRQELEGVAVDVVGMLLCTVGLRKTTFSTQSTILQKLL